MDSFLPAKHEGLFSEGRYSRAHSCTEEGNKLHYTHTAFDCHLASRGMLVKEVILLEMASDCILTPKFMPTSLNLLWDALVDPCVYGGLLWNATRSGLPGVSGFPPPS